MMDGWGNVDIEKQQKKRKMGKIKRKMGKEERWLEQPHARTMIV